MNKTNNIQDEFLTRLVRKTGSGSPSPDFTEKVMNKIYADKAVQNEKQAGLFSLGSWIWISAAVIIITMVLLFADFGFINNIFENLNSRNLQFFNLLANIKNTLSEAFQTIRFSSLSLIILISALSLFILDRAIRKIRAFYFCF
ncbi:MAG: hypothetical protein KKA81_10500 [Bacteroidetes bacterium]|nr:hypothetical protein [Bacteroidota bacterium]